LDVKRSAILIVPVLLVGCAKEAEFEGKPTSAWIEQMQQENGTREEAEAIYALGQIGAKDKSVVPALIDALRNKKTDVRSQVADALGQIGPEANDAVSALTDSLQKGDEFLRAASAKALGKIGPDAKAAVPVLIHAIGDKDAFVRFAAVEALGNIGPSAKAAVPSLIQATKGPDSGMRRVGQDGDALVSAAKEAVKKIDPNACRSRAVRVAPSVKHIG
jgi:HEAT repeat protein